MDKQILERACVVFQWSGYAYIIYTHLYNSSGSESIINTVLGIAVPLITRWVLTGKLKIKPVLSKSEED